MGVGARGIRITERIGLLFVFKFLIAIFDLYLFLNSSHIMILYAHIIIPNNSSKTNRCRDNAS